jgi:4-amino-4-deoxy-L-arabinose transferase-like glycosyltransferase
MVLQSKPDEGKIISGRMELAGRIAILVISLLLLSRNINSMYLGYREENSATYSVFARNHVRYGLGFTKLFNTDISIAGSKPYRYLNHPPLLSVFTAIPIYIFGEQEWVGRSVAIAATLAGAWILMVIISRMQSAAMGLLTGLFYVTLPITAYFGRILDHEPLVQFFSLLMLYGYLLWSGIYGEGCNRKAGAMYYVLGTVLGIGTGWAAVIMAGLIWVWNICRSIREVSVRPLILWLTAVPAVSLAAVFIHILWGFDWRAEWLLHLFSSRTIGPQDSMQWVIRNWGWIKQNFTVFGIGAAVIYTAVIPAILLFSSSDSPLRRIVRNRMSVMPILLTLVMGVIWLIVFKHESGLHEYWQYYCSPFVAASMAGVVLGVFVAFSRLSLRAAVWVMVLLMVLPMPFFAGSINRYHQLGEQTLGAHIAYMNKISRLYKKLKEFVPTNVPAMTSENYRSCEKFGDNMFCWIDHGVSYYVDRPLICSTDVNEIGANAQGCAAYVIVVDDPHKEQLAQQLASKYKVGWQDEGFIFFLLTAKN